MIKNETFKKYLALNHRLRGDKDKQKLNLHYEKLILFFDTRLCFDAISVNPFFFSRMGSKNNDVVVFLHCLSKTVQNFNIIFKIYIVQCNFLV